MLPVVNVGDVVAELRELRNDELTLEGLGHQHCALVQHPAEVSRPQGFREYIHLDVQSCL